MSVTVKTLCYFLKTLHILIYRKFDKNLRNNNSQNVKNKLQKTENNIFIFILPFLPEHLDMYCSNIITHIDTNC